LDAISWIEIRAGGIKLVDELREGPNVSELLGFCALRETKIRYKQAAFCVILGLRPTM
jgi:hypothetical protein